MTRETFDTIVDFFGGAKGEVLNIYIGDKIKDLVKVSVDASDGKRSPETILFRSALTAICLARVACMADGELQDKEKEFAYIVFGDLESIYPNYLTMDKIYEILNDNRELNNEEYTGLKNMCKYSLRACGAIIGIIFSFLVSDGNLNVAEKALMEKYLPELTEGYSDEELLIAIMG